MDKKRSHTSKFVAMRVMVCIVLSLVWFVSFGQYDMEAIIKSEQADYQGKRDFRSKRSGSDYDIVYHRLKLRVDPAVRQLSGSVVSHFRTVQSSFTELSFDLDDNMTVDSVLYHGSQIGHTHSNDAITIALSLDSNVLDSVEVFYHGDPTQSKQKAVSFDLHQTGPIAWTLSEPYGAYGWWPCKQQLEDKIDSLDMSIEVPLGNRSAGLGLLTRVDTLQSALVFHWKHRYPVVTYLVAFAVTNYDEFTHYAHFMDGDSLPILEYMYPEYMAIAEREAYKTDTMMYLFDSLIGDYPFRKEKYGHALWGRGGGMEHQTMSFMSDLDFGLVAHELVHQWFGNKVTCGSWQDIWLNEGFATFFTAVAYEMIRPSEQLEFLQAQLDRATSESDGSVFVYDTTSVSRIFSGRLSYSKAAYVLRMLRWTMGDESFFTAVRNYMADAELCYEFARTADLQYYMEQAYGQSLDSFIYRWVYQQGFPLLTIGWQRTTSTSVQFQIAQQSSHTSVRHFPLKIPLRLIGAEGQDTVLLLDHVNTRDEMTFELGFKLVGVEYDPERWLLAKATVLEGDHRDLSSVSLFPNPSQQSFEVYVQDQRVDAISIYNRLGQLVDEIETNARKNEAVPVRHDLGKGLYYVKVVVGESSVTLPLVVY